MKEYLRLEVLRTVRDPLYTALAVVAPIGFYLLFAGLFGSAPHPPGSLSGNVGIMVAMAVYGGIWACLVATGPRIAVERGNGWLKNLQLLPITSRETMIARIIAAILFALPAMLLVYATAIIVHGVSLPTSEWLAMILLMWIGIWPFAILGIVIGYLTNTDSAFGVTFGIYETVSALGGLWVPPTILPTTMLNIGKLLPTYQAADLGWHIALSKPPTWTSAITLAIWAVTLTVIAVLLAPRARQAR
jgi:ABC-2 type transport system permease protein